ncbi:hypothetical protein CEN49_10325 [Fischerella thermalis CCMEE 5273]|uniref:ABC transporter domain-containing protein n=1 Tax=Fischerella thermalis JSC-11 TaxID=741277 RepID=G6FPG0_9CYAN|nr:ATP-binding cassette domain-containing protein [Fischerella thermalis]EHC18760.1 hypothetical protein FJSC11DRAFT_0740 [Fischerella thermalis JSC-11]PMB08299.1 hypothetical protein CEN49_10325 [Fischerella thermalis CCMEE 5273]
MTKSTSFAMDDRHKLNNSAFLEIENLVKSYPKNDGGEFVVLDNVNLTVGEDEYISVIGHSGCGKSTLLKMDEPFGALDALTRGKLQRQVLDIWENHRQAVMMITHDVDEAIYMSDRIILMTNGPAAKIGEILEVPFSHPRDRAYMRNSEKYYELRNYALNFLERNFTTDE